MHSSLVLSAALGWGIWVEHSDMPRTDNKALFLESKKSNIILHYKRKVISINMVGKTYYEFKS